MIKITNGVDTLLVPNGAYEAQYKPFGWKPAKAASKSNKKNEDAELKKAEEERMKAEAEAAVRAAAETDDEEDEDVDDDENQDIEKPLGEMSGKELKRKAESLGIDVSDMKSKREVRDAIAAVINQ